MRNQRAPAGSAKFDHGKQGMSRNWSDGVVEQGIEAGVPERANTAALTTPTLRSLPLPVERAFLERIDVADEQDAEE